MSRTLRSVGAGIMIFYTAFFLLMLFGEAIADLGGWRGFAVVGVPGLVYAGLALVVWHRPRLALWIVGPMGLVAAGYHALIGLEVIDRSIETNTPVPVWVLQIAFLAIPTFVIAGVHALHRPVEGGLVMVLLGALLALTRPVPGAILGLPALIAGVAFLVAVRSDRSDPERRPDRLTPAI